MPEHRIVRVPAKINLSLRVGAREDDGFHPVRTIYHAVDLYDTVTLTESDRLRLQITGPEAAGLSAGPTNLASRAATLVAERFTHSATVQIALHKKIPVAAGLAGGSADAAGVLIGLNELWQLGLSLVELAGLAAELGSDVAFALYGGTALGTGRGEQITPLPQTHLNWVLAAAHGELPTGSVFAELDAQRADGRAPLPTREDAQVLAAIDSDDQLLEALRSADPTTIAGLLVNDLQPASLALADYLPAALQAGLDAGALGALVSGSGPTVALLSADAEHARTIANKLNESPTCRFAVPVRGGVPGAAVTDDQLQSSELANS